MQRWELIRDIGKALIDAATLIVLIWCAVLLSNLTPGTLPAAQVVSVPTEPPPVVQATPTHQPAPMHQPAPTAVQVAEVYRNTANIRSCIEARESTERRIVWEITYPDANCF